jgi:hypothetical protein
MVLYKRRGSRGFDSRRGQLFFSEDRITGGSRGFDSRRAQEKSFFWDSTACTDRLCALAFPHIFCAANMFRLCALSF